MADSNRLTEALKELADALPRGSDNTETRIDIEMPSDAFEAAVVGLETDTYLRGHSKVGIRCGHCKYTLHVSTNPTPLVDLK